MQIKQIKIEVMTEHHLDRIYDIEMQSFKAPWSYIFFLEELANPHAINLAACVDGCVAGYILCRRVVNEGHINNVAVAEKYRRHGIGGALIRRLSDIIRAEGMIGLTLEVAAGNFAAQALYAKHGFVAEGLRKNYYEGNEDAVIMWKYF